MDPRSLGTIGTSSRGALSLSSECQWMRLSQEVPILTATAVLRPPGRAIQTSARSTTGSGATSRSDTPSRGTAPIVRRRSYIPPAHFTYRLTLAQNELQPQQGRWLRAQNRGALDPFTHSSRVSLQSSLDPALLAAVPDGELQACVRHREVSASGLIVRDWRRPDSPRAFGNAPVTSITRKSCRRRLWRPPTGSGGGIGRAEERSTLRVRSSGR